MLFMFHVCHAVLYVPCRIVVTCWEKDDLLAFLYVMFSCFFVTFPYDVLSRVWYLIVSIPDLFLFPYTIEWNGLKCCNNQQVLLNILTQIAYRVNAKKV